MIKTILFPFLIFTFGILAQDNEDKNKQFCDSLLKNSIKSPFCDSIANANKETEVKTEAEKNKEAILDRLSTSENFNIGAFTLSRKFDSTISAFGEGKTVNIIIEEVTITIDKGRIQRLIVKVKDHFGYYKNQGPISVTCFDKCRGYKVKYFGSDPKLQNTTIEIGDFLDYIDYTSRLAYPPKGNFVLNETKLIDTLKFSGSPIEFFDVRAYSDANGLSGEPNGLAQTEINARFIGNTRSGEKNYYTWLPYVNMNFAISKFDSKFDTLSITSFSNRSNNDLLPIVQYSNIGFKVELELIRYSRIHDAYINIGHHVYSTQMTDTIGYKRIFTPAFYATIGGTMFNFPKIKAEFKIPFMICYLGDQPFTQYEKNANLMIVPEIEIIIDPITTTDKKNTDPSSGITLFGRIKYFDMPNYRGNNFWQLQLGAQIPLTDAFK